MSVFHIFNIVIRRVSIGTYKYYSINADIKMKFRQHWIYSYSNQYRRILRVEFISDPNIILLTNQNNTL